ncbi:hypothetical protein [Saccharibacillus kuerlensis]|uniref:DUF3600 domain-containing protein n=1 Tax=Saccharibacillus kuerlensis TaxID=459527 RepID=A0ABQ2L4E0_9BACL|nr:hypothetical protein [Saccharibacillus kuerlensis]GGO02529.1 hypothetical protein GCM10010969_25940 [Saccharibacillus kuerlensis]
MGLEQELQSALQKKTRDWKAPEEVLRKISAQIEANETTSGSAYADRHRSKVRKRILVAVLSAVLILPAGAYAGYHYLADAIYGSKGNFGGDLNAYEQLEAKLQTVKSQMSDSEYAQLTRLLREAASLINPHVGEDGQVKTSEMSVEELERLEALEQEIVKQTAGLDTSEEARAQADENFTEEDFWAEMIVKAEQKFDSTEYAEFRALIEKAKGYGREWDEPTMERLNSYLSRLGARVEKTK